MKVPLALKNLIYERNKLILQIVGIAAALALIALLLGLRHHIRFMVSGIVCVIS